MKILSSIGAFFTSRLFFVLVGIVAIGLLIWFLGARIGYADVYPLVSENSRIAAIAGIVVIWLLFELLRRWRLRRLNQMMIESLVQSQSLATLADSRAEDELDLIRQRFEQALRLLRDRTISGRGGDHYLYDLPWYVVIGPPGSGKTTILQNSGLDFPLAEELGVEVVEGFGGTQTCDWWFSDEAVLIDTAGRYTTQDVNPESDRIAWTGFLDTLKTNRSRRPLNGVILSISMQDMQNAQTDEANRAAEAIKARIQEIMRVFRMRIPVYVLFTKCDLISGFTEFFDDLDEQGRDQVWGVTLEPEASNTAVKALQELAGQIDQLVRNLTSRMTQRLDDERDVVRRKKIFAFPQQVSGLKRPLDRFLADVFRPSRYSTQPILRGVYFTSGAQLGVPFDGLLDIHASAYGIETANQAPQEDGGRSFFINRLLREVVFAERYLAGADRRTERRLFWTHASAYVALFAVVGGMAVAWNSTTNRGHAAVEDVQARLTKYTELVATYSRSPGIKTAIPALDTLRLNPAGHGSFEFSKLITDFGLTAEGELHPRLAEAYHNALAAMLKPTLINTLERQLAKAARNSADTGEVRQILALYLGLRDPDRFDRTGLDRWVELQGENLFLLQPDRQGQMNEIFGDLLDEWSTDVKLDNSLIELARGELFDVPPAEQIYSKLRTKSFSAGDLPLNLRAAVGLNGSQMFVYRKGMTRAPSVPALYTSKGFYGNFLKDTQLMTDSPAKDDWLLGTVDSGGSQESSEIVTQVSDFYTRDYVNAWMSFLDGLAMRKIRDVQDANVILTTLSGPDSPLNLLLQTVKANTELPISGIVTGGAKAPADDASKPAGGASGTDAAATAGGGAASKAAASLQKSASEFGPFSSWPGTKIEKPFGKINALITPIDGKEPALTAVQQRVVDLYAAINLVATAPDITKAAYDEVNRRLADPRNHPIMLLAQSVSAQPSPVREIITGLATGSWDVLLTESRKFLDAQWRREVVPECNRSILRRYPVYEAEKDESTLVDFSSFFGPAGVIDGFFSTYLAPFVDTTGAPWKNQNIEGQGLMLAPETLEAFRNARLIRNAFFGKEAGSAGARFSLTPTFLAANAARIALDIDGELFTYRHEPPRSFDIVWPGAKSTTKVTITMTDLNGATDTVTQGGPWAWFRLFDKFGLQPTELQDKFQFSPKLLNLDARFELGASSVSNPFNLRSLTAFRCRADL
jgi:type VI secretion system protein ImpL